MKLWYTLPRWPFCFSTSICWIQWKDLPNTVTLLLKFKILDFKTFSHVLVYSIEYVSYRQGHYRIRIISAADHIVPALISMHTFVFLRNMCKVWFVTVTFLPLFVFQLASYFLHHIFHLCSCVPVESKWTICLFYCNMFLSLI